MQGVERRSEARIGQLLGPAVEGNPNFTHAESCSSSISRAADRHDFRLLARALDGDCYLTLEEWRKAKDKELIEKAAELRKYAERRLGEMMKAQAETVGLHSGGRPRKTTVSETVVFGRPPTLKEAGIDENLAKRARKAAALSEQDFEVHVHEAKAAASD